MPDGSAYRPGDIVRCYNGKTVEIINTDAEGRMILADALGLGGEREAGRDRRVLDPHRRLRGGARTDRRRASTPPTTSWRRGLLAAADAAGERLWRMPLWPEFLEEMKGTHADLKNSGGRWGGASHRGGVPVAVRRRRRALGAPRHRRPGLRRRGTRSQRRRHRLRRRVDDRLACGRLRAPIAAPAAGASSDARRRLELRRPDDHLSGRGVGGHGRARGAISIVRAARSSAWSESRARARP